jgi:hypothetical protein
VRWLGRAVAGAVLVALAVLCANQGKAPGPKMGRGVRVLAVRRSEERLAARAPASAMAAGAPK